MKFQNLKFLQSLLWTGILVGAFGLQSALFAGIASDKGGPSSGSSLPGDISQLFVSPDPAGAEAFAFINLVSGKSAELQIFSLNGELIFKEYLPNLSPGLSKVPLSFQSFSDGLYFATLVGQGPSDAELVLQTKFAIQHRH